jgi:outer membrane protein OmpA-like peptidoglycan-associated protein
VGEVIFPPSSPLRNITFAGCSAALGDDARSRLRKLAEGLRERPAMKITAFGYVDRDLDEKACQERLVADRVTAGKAAAPVPAGAAPPLEGEARLEQLAERRAVAVRDFLVVQGNVDPSRITATTADVHAAPRQTGEPQARVEFARGTD